MPRLSRLRSDLLAVADAQMGLVTAAQLAELGVSTATTSRRVAGGMWTRVLPGVHLVYGGQPQRDQRSHAALLYSGDGSCLTGTIALAEYGVRRLESSTDPARPEPVHVLVEHGRRRKSAGYVRVERTRRMPDAVVVRRGLALAPVARCVADAARRMTRGRDVLALVTEVLQMRLCTWEELKQELDEGQRRGSAYLREALAATASGAESPPEADLAKLLGEAHPGLWQWNVRVVDRRGRLLGIPDAWRDDLAVALEVDSVEHHATRSGFERTVRRNARYAAAGVVPVTILPTDIRDRPRGILAQIEEALDAARSRPRPEVTVQMNVDRSAGSREWRWGA